MSSNWIPTGNDAARVQSQLRNAIQQLQQAQANLLQTYNIMSQMVGGGSDYTVLETTYGLTSGTGSTVIGIVGTASTDLQGSNIQGLLQRLG